MKFTKQAEWTLVPDCGAGEPCTCLVEACLLGEALPRQQSLASLTICKDHFFNLSFQILIKKMICSGKRSFLKEQPLPNYSR